MSKIHHHVRSKYEAMSRRLKIAYAVLIVVFMVEFAAMALIIKNEHTSPCTVQQYGTIITVTTCK